ncbi:hypothetical protein MNBD_ALPHA06-1955 [hydrothermal vent metagenome]|uniref:Mercuric transport protein, MerT n=1 Tax=hydrothermal vent metagenome TaxID=652676 RepID=A0A3B0REV5_9ZZZZ
MTEKTQTPPNNGWLTGGSAFSGLLAFISASCCVLPILLVNVGISSALVGHLAFFARHRSWFLGFSVLAIVLALAFAFRGGRRPNKMMLVLLIVSSLLIAIAYAMPYFEGTLIRWMYAR